MPDLTVFVQQCEFGQHWQLTPDHASKGAKLQQKTVVQLQLFCSLNKLIKFFKIFFNRSGNNNKGRIYQGTKITKGLLVRPKANKLIVQNSVSCLGLRLFNYLQLKI